MREEAQQTETEGTGSRAGKLIPLVVLVACLVVGSGAGAFMLGPKLFAAPSTDAAAGGHGEKKSEGGGHGEEAGAALATLDNLVINPANSGGTRFLLISFAFELGDAEPAAITAAEPQLRDTFVTLLSRRTIAELSDLSLRDSIRSELLRAADSIVPGIEKLYIPQFVMQ